MFKHTLLGAGAALALTVTPAYAQSAPPLEPRIVVAESKWSGVRAAKQGDNDLGVMTLADYKATYPERGEAGFNSILESNRQSCAETGEWIRESIAIMGETNELDAEWSGIAYDLAKLGNDLNTAANLRTGTHIISSGLLCALSGGLYCGAAVAAGFSNEIGNRSHRKQSQVNRKQSQLNVTQSRLQLRATVLTMRMNIGWAKEMNWYCLRHHVDATIGVVPTASVSPPRTTPELWPEKR